MAAIFLRSTDGNDGNAGTQKEAPKATLAAALTAAGAGGSVYMSSIHAETQASAMTLTSPGTAASPVRVLCVADWGAATGTEIPTTLATTGTVTTTGNSNLLGTGYTYFYGVTFTPGSGASGTASFGINTGTNSFLVLDTCQVTLGSTGTSSRINCNAAGFTGAFRMVFVNTNVTFGSVSQSFAIGFADFQWNGGSLTGATIPTTLFASSSSVSVIALQGVDLSAAGSGKNIFALDGSAPTHPKMRDCKLGASVSPATGTIVGQASMTLLMVNCDSVDTNYRLYYQDYCGTITHETTITRTGGATNGTTPVSRKMVSSANSKFYLPLDLGKPCPLVVWNESTSSLTVTVHVVTDNVTLTDAECWIEIEEPGNSGYPLSVTQSDRAADILVTPANQSTSTEAWTTTGLTTPVYQKLHKTFTPAGKGPFKVRVVLAKPSTTVYVCPKLEVS